MSVPLTNSSKVTAVGILWFLLSLTTVIILTMAGSWAASISAHQTLTDQRINTLEQNFGLVIGQLQDLREQGKVHDQKLDRILERQGSYVK